jgi:hypothetical protein
MSPPQSSQRNSKYRWNQSWSGRFIGTLHLGMNKYEVVGNGRQLFYPEAKI